MSVPYEPLHVHSTYSLLHGTQSVDALAERAARYGHRALALTDRNNFYGALPFVEACRNWGVRPILGVEVDGPEGSAVLLVRNAEGYAHACRIVSQRMLNPDFSLVAALSDWHAGLFVLTPCPGLLRTLAGAIPREFLWGELAAPGGTAPRFDQVLAACRDTGLKAVATPAATAGSRADHALHRTLVAARENTLVTQLPPGQAAHPEAWFKAPAAMVSLFRRYPEALRHSLDIADQCRYVPGPVKGDDGRKRWILPSLCLPGGETPQEHLRRLCHRGLLRRYRRKPSAALRRLSRELDLIHRLGFTDYFVIVGDLVAFAHKRGIATVGRGSGAGSLTAYLLGITNVDPLRYGLYFERFLHEKRDDCPDLDIDLCWKRRDDVIEYVYETYGRERTAMISTHNTLRLRSAFREAARAFGVPARTVNALSKRLPHGGDDLAAAVHRIPPPPQESWDQGPWPRVLAHGQAMLGMPRNLGIHPGGVVIADRPIDMYVPLEEATKGIVVTQYEMRAIEAVGLVKMDLLGNRAISTIQETVDLVAEGTGVRLEPDAFPHRDRATASLMSRGDTLGVFQMESPGMRNLNRMLQTRDLATTIAAVALIRPGPAGSGMKERFVRRCRGLEVPAPLHPKLAHVLRGTYGVPLYEEDVMRIAAEAAGLSLEDGDMVRRAIGEAKPPELRELGRVFRRAACKQGFSPESAERVWNHLLQFGAFAFCKAHAAGYGVLSYQSAWLKAHHPVEFTCALVNHHAGMYDTRTHLQDAQRRGVRILLPDINASRDGATVEGGAVRLGLSLVRGLQASTREALLRERRLGRYASLVDCLSRVPMARSEAEALILSGAGDAWGRSRPELLCMLAVWRKQRAPRPAPRLFTLAPQEPPVPLRPEFGDVERLWMEWHLTGACVGRHPLECFESGFSAGPMTLREAEATYGSRVRVWGVAAARRTVRTKDNAPMQFLTLDDPSGMLECTLFPEVYRRHRGLVRGLGPFLVEGRMEDQYGAPTLNVERLAPLPLPPALQEAEHRVSAVLGPLT